MPVPSLDRLLKKSVLRRRKDKTVLIMESIPQALEVETIKVVIAREVGAEYDFGSDGVAEVVVVFSLAASVVLLCDGGGGGLRIDCRI